MNVVPTNKILELRPDTVEYVRKLFNLEKPENMKEAINILNEWIQKQSHFNKKDFSNLYLEKSIILCKGSVERAKSQMDKICTMKTLLPNFFGNFNFKTDFGNLHEVSYIIMLPKLTEDHCRIYLCKFRRATCEASLYMNLFRETLILSEYVKIHDYVSEFIILMDFSEVDLLDYIVKLNPIEWKQMATILIDGFGVRLKSLKLVTQSKLIDKLVLMLKQILSPKLAARISVCKNYEQLHEIIPKYILPKDYGGEERSLDILQDEWIEALSSEEHLDYMRDINRANTDESRRAKDKFTELYGGIPGTFRFLGVD